jgi:FemAB-related protein (PEP-CTERM system-associated)
MRVVHYMGEYRDRWQNYVEESDTSTLYHRLGWKDVIERSFGHTTYYVLAEDGGTIKGILPMVLIGHPFFGKSLVSMPFLNCGGVCADTKEAECLLLDEAIRITKKENVDYLELRQTEKIDSNLITRDDKVAMVVKLEPDSERLWGGLTPKLRQTIRKAEKAGLQVKVGKEENLEDFYEIFSANMKELGSPVYGRSFFGNTLSDLKDEMLIFVVTHKEKAVGAACVGFFKDSIEGFWASSLREYFRLNPNEYLYWKQLEYGCQNGYSFFNLGRSTKDSGSFRFKQKFGADMKQLYWQYYLNKTKQIPEMDPTALKYKIAVGVWRRLPLSVTRTVGPQIRKYMSQ